VVRHFASTQPDVFPKWCGRFEVRWRERDDFLLRRIDGP
jgi:hypothetical protein